MKNKRVVMALILLIAVSLAGLATYLANEFIQEKIETETARLANVPKPKMVISVVPTRSLPKGTVVRKQDIATREVPEEWVHSGMVTPANYEIAVGQELAFDVDKGKPLLWAHLKGGSAPTFSGLVVDGQRALTIPVDKISSISGFLQPHDRIDLIITYKKWGREYSRPFLQNLLVLAAGEQIEVDKSADGKGPRSVSTVTLLVSPDDAKRIIHAQTVGKLTATLRNPNDAEPVAVASVSENNLFGEVAKRTVRRTVPKRNEIEYIIGGRAAN